MYRHVPLCTVMSRYVPSCPGITVMYRHVPLCTVMSRYVPSCPVMYRHVPLCTVMYRYVPSCPIMYRHVPSCTVISRHIPLVPLCPVKNSCLPSHHEVSNPKLAFDCWPKRRARSPSSLKHLAGTGFVPEFSGNQ
jgi:hypothetical protein